MSQGLHFEVPTPLGFTVRRTRAYWEFIIREKHPVLARHETDVKEALSHPDEIRRSRKDAQVFLFYRGGKPRWLCAIVRRDDAAGFLITAYPTDVVKAEETIWTKSE
jgi:hypothetical protein